MQLIQRHHRQGGFTIAELMIGITVGMLVMAAAASVYVTTVRNSAENLREVKLSQELRTITDIMVSDVRRAGYWANLVAGNADVPLDNVPTLVDPAVGTQVDGDNPFTVDATVAAAAGINPTDVTILNGGECILYAYDATYRPGDTFAVDATDYFGFRLNGTDLQMRQSGNTTGACDDGAWETVNDSNIVIDTLTFSTEGSQCLNTSVTGGAQWMAAPGATTPACDPATVGYTAATGDLLTETRQITITLQGHHTSDANARVTFVEQVKLRNNRIVVAP